MSVPVVIVLVAALLGLAPAALGAPGDARVVQGTVEWTPGQGGAPFVVLFADDGRHYVADLSAVLPVPVLTRGDRVAVTGQEGSRPHEVVARRLTVLALAPGGPSQPAGARPAPGSPPTPGPGWAVEPSGASPAASPGQPASPEPPGGPPAPPRLPGPRDPAPERLEGRVESVSGHRLTLRTREGRTVAVELPAGRRGPAFSRGDEVTVYGHRAGDRFVANGVVRVEDAGGAALPRPRR